MALYYQFCRRFAAITAIFFLYLTLLPLQSGTGIKTRMKEEEVRKMVVGSRPPGCVNKCMSCRPCEATLVILPHKIRANFVKSSSHASEDGSYYLLAWKCRCGNEIYQP